MATAYTSLLGLALPVTGELSGTWGSTVNTEITALLDSAIAGTTTLSTDADVTLTTTTGAANTSRQAILLCSGARTVLRTITAPAQSKIYTIINATTGGFSVKLVGAGPTTGVTVVAGESAVCAWNGSDFIKISNTAGVGTFTNLTVTGTLGVTGVATFSAGTAALPAITTTGDTNTGIFFPAADTIAFSEGGAEAMRIDSSGNLGIGMTPSTKLDVAIAGGMVRAGGASGNNLMQVYTGTNGLGLWAGGSTRLYSTGGLTFSVNSTLTTGTPTGYTDAMTLDSSGNLLVGTTTPVFNLAGRGLITINGSSAAALGFTAGAVDKGIILHTGTDMIMSNSVSGALTFQTNNQERARIDSSGRLGIGSTSPSSPLTISKTGATAIEISSGPTYPVNSYGAGTGATQFAIANTGGTSYFGNESSTAGTSFTGTSAYSTLLGTGAARSLQFVTNGAVQATIDSSGNFLVGATSTLGSTAGILVANSGANVQAITTNSTSSSAYYIGRFYSGGTEKGYIYFDGTNVSYTNLSDYRLKENVQPMQNALDKVAKLNPVTYNWKSNGKAGQGFIAHELKAVVPDCVTGDKDALDEEGNPKYQGVDTSFLVATLTAAIQELNAKFEAYKATHP